MDVSKSKIDHFPAAENTLKLSTDHFRYSVSKVTGAVLEFMRCGLYNSYLSVVGCFPLIMFCGQIGAAEKIQGVAVYEVFAPNGSRLVKVEEKFDAIVEGDHWLINTRLLKLEPPSNYDQVFCPPQQEAGSDGKDCFYLKTMAVGGTNKFVGWVEPGVVPTTTQSPTVVLLWLAYCSGSRLSSESKSMRPVWVGGIDDKNRQGKCEMPIHFEKSAAKARFLEKLYYLCDGRANPCEPKDATNNFLPPPWSNGFTQAVFRVERSFDLGSTNLIPSVFRFDVYMPQGRPGGSEIALRVSSSISAVATNVATGIQVSEWTPKLPPEVIIGVYDYRFTTAVTNSEAVSYVAKGKWRSKADEEVFRAVKVLTTKTKDDVKTDSQSSRAGWIRFVLLLLIGLPAAAMYIFFHHKNKQTTTRTTI